jgi:hypothetical protein
MNPSSFQRVCTRWKTAHSSLQTVGDPWSEHESPTSLEFFSWTIATIPKPAGQDRCGIAVDESKAYLIFKVSREDPIFTYTWNNVQYTFFPDYTCVDPRNRIGYPDNVYICFATDMPHDSGIPDRRGVAFYRYGRDADAGKTPDRKDYSWVNDRRDGQLFPRVEDPWKSRLSPHFAMKFPSGDQFQGCITSRPETYEWSGRCGTAMHKNWQGMYIYKDYRFNPKQPSFIIKENVAGQEVSFNCHAFYFCVATNENVVPGEVDGE